ncbi:hypothetical protein CHRY9293_03576 [Chryseobacterium potabilaquae]|uniref:Uncharacterized protein n=2 Tax=Chryseobacterium potabilaquae TaxID=2675057 RepID=A0A6N4XB37_9FLAO|nr:hypothetical protein CHRY9293_03576 [Chryseobacterium potabilaquae]
MDKHSKQSTQQNQTAQSKVKIFINIIVSTLVLISAILPFLNNIIGYFTDVNIQLDNNAGERRLDLDSSIYFLSIGLGYVLLSIAGILECAHKKTYYVVLISSYFHLITYVKFIFFNKNEISAIADIAIIIILIVIIFLIYWLNNYYNSIKKIDEFNNTTLNRFSILLNKHNKIKEDE